jgi:hypothetical protein
MDATCLKAHRTATSMAEKKGGRGCLIGRTKGGMNTKLHAICDRLGRPLNLFLTAGPVSDNIGARALLGSLPKVGWLHGDPGASRGGSAVIHCPAGYCMAMPERGMSISRSMGH